MSMQQINSKINYCMLLLRNNCANAQLCSITCMANGLGAPKVQIIQYDVGGACGFLNARNMPCFQYFVNISLRRPLY